MQSNLGEVYFENWKFQSCKSLHRGDIWIRTAVRKPAMWRSGWWLIDVPVSIKKKPSNQQTA